MHRSDARVLAQAVGEVRGALALALDAYGHRRGAALQEPAIEGRCARTADGLHGANAFKEFIGFAHHNHAAQRIAMTAEIFGGRVHYDVCAVFKRSRTNRRRPRIVSRQQCAACVRVLSRRGNVRNAQTRIGRRLDPNKLCVGLPRAGDLVEISCVYERRLQAPARVKRFDDGDAKVRRLKEKFNRSNRSFLGIHYSDCYEDTFTIYCVKELFD